MVLIDGISRKDDALRLEVTRTINGIGNWALFLRNTGGKYNGAFDVQDSLLVQADTHAVIGGRVDGQAVTLRGRDLESIWDEYCILRGVDSAQDLGFHNDFEHDYPNTSQQLKTVMDDVFNTQLAGLTNILYIPPVGATPVIGAVEFREGSSFLTQLQEMHKRAPYIFYVDDGLIFRSGSPGFSAAGLTFHSSPGASNIIDVVDYQERDGDKHYNYVKVYGKNPMFDGYTELNASSWNTASAGRVDWNIDRMVGDYCIAAYNYPVAVGPITLSLTTPKFNYNSWNFSRGEIGIWAKYDNNAGAPGTPGAGAAAAQERVTCSLMDFSGNVVNYYGDSTALYRGEWGYCTFPLGEQLHTPGGMILNTWYLSVGASFDWSQVTAMVFSIGDIGTDPSHFLIDGIGLPIPCLSIIESAPAQALYRRRPYIDVWSHLKTQNALDSAVAAFLPQVNSTAISTVRFVVPFDYRLRYAGQSFDLNIPSLNINTEVFYATQLKTVIEPMADVSNGFGFDAVIEVEACPVSGVTYDMSRLRVGSIYSATQMNQRIGAGMRIK